MKNNKIYINLVKSAIFNTKLKDIYIMPIFKESVQILYLLKSIPWSLSQNKNVNKLKKVF